MATRTGNVLAAGLLVLAATHASWAFSIDGTISDTTGVPVVGALVVLTDEAAPFERLTAITDVDGRYRLDWVPTATDRGRSASTRQCRTKNQAAGRGYASSDSTSSSA